MVLIALNHQILQCHAGSNMESGQDTAIAGTHIVIVELQLILNKIDEQKW